MFLKKLIRVKFSKSGQAVGGEVLRWIVYIMILAAAAFVVVKIISLAG